jgi:hypothetical protein
MPLSALRLPGRLRLPWLAHSVRPADSEETAVSTESLSPRERYWRDWLLRAYRATPPTSRPQ